MRPACSPRSGPLLKVLAPLTLSVIIVNYNVRSFLENALTSISRAMTGIEGEVFVVDNASNDGSAAMVRGSFPSVHLIENTENVGFARANNMAIHQAAGEFILLINPDTVVQEDTFRVMLAFFKEHPEAGLAGCKVLNPDGSFQLPCRRSFPTPWVAFTKVFGLAGLFPHSRLFGRYNLTYLDPAKTYPVDAVSGSFMMVRRTVYEKVGGLDESFFMYGEDLDWCYRVRGAGWKVFYVHETAIIHFKGESTKRSDIDEVRVFYSAMQLFVAKHFGRFTAVRAFLSFGIAVRETMASLALLARTVLRAAADMAVVDLALVLGGLIYFGDVERFASGADPIIWFAPALLVVLSMAGVGAYSMYRNSARRAALGVLLGYVLISAAVFFVKHLAYSRAVVAYSGVISIVVLPGLRIALRQIRKPGSEHRRSLFGSRTLIVGTGPSAREILRKLRARVDDGYDVVGFIDTTNRSIGEKLDGVGIVGSLENVGKVVGEQKVSDVIFSTDGLSYGEILSVIARSNTRSVNFRLVPNSLEAIIGKTRIDQLDTLPLVDIAYNLHLPSRRLLKRGMDLVLSFAGLVVLWIPAILLSRGSEPGFGRLVRELPAVLAGRKSLVGLPGDGDGGFARDLSHRCGGADLGPIGLTGLIQINNRPGLTDEEVDRYALYYAKNQSLWLDVEIIAKSLL